MTSRIKGLAAAGLAALTMAGAIAISTREASAWTPGSRWCQMHPRYHSCRVGMRPQAMPMSAPTGAPSSAPASGTSAPPKQY